MKTKKFSLSGAGRAIWSAFVVLSLVVVASVIGVGGAAMFIYHQMGNSVSVAKASPRESVDRTYPKLQAVSSGKAAADWEIAELSDKPRFTYVSYDGGRRRARLRVTTVLDSRRADNSMPPPLTPGESDVMPTVSDEGQRPPLAEPASKYIISEHTGRVIGIDGTAGAAMEARQYVPEVRVAAPVLENGRAVFRSGNNRVLSETPVQTQFMPVRRALPVEPSDREPDDVGGVVSSPSTSFSVERELADEDDVPVQRALPVNRAPRPANQGRIFRLPFGN